MTRRGQRGVPAHSIPLPPGEVVPAGVRDLQIFWGDRDAPRFKSSPREKSQRGSWPLRWLMLHEDQMN